MKRRVFALPLILLLLGAALILSAPAAAFAEETAAEGWVQDHGNWYYVLEDGKRATGWLELADGWYYMDRGGIMHTGWLQVKNKWYYFEESGRMHYGWLSSNGNWYYFGDNGAMTTGWLKWRNDWYFFEASGHLHTGWLQWNNKWFFFNESGVMCSSCLRTIGGKEYFFLEDGRMAADQSVSVNGVLYYVGKNGLVNRKTGWVGSYDDNRWYFAEEGGKLLQYQIRKINGVIYSFREDGSAREAVDLPAAQKALELGSLREAFNYSRTLKYGGKYTWTEDHKSDYLASIGMKSGYGNCFVYAALFRELAAELGYDAHQVWGYVPYPGNRVVKHSWVEIVMDGQTYVFDPEASWQFRKDFYQFQYGQKGTFRYEVVGRMN